MKNLKFRPLKSMFSRSPQVPTGENPKGFIRGISGMRLQTRLTVLILLVAVPVLIVGTYLTNLRGQEIIEQQAAEQLRLTNSTIARDTSTQMDFSVQILNQLALMPDIISMDPVRQKPVLKAVNTTNPDFYLVHTLDLAGINVARSDDAENKDYHDRKYFQIPVDGGPVTFQSVKGKTSGLPALTIGTAIRNAQGGIVGVIGVAINLTALSNNVQASKVGQTGYVYVVDQNNLVVAHPDPTYTAELTDFSTYPPVAMMRQGNLGMVEFEDEQGSAWHAYTAVLENGWGVVVQQENSEYLQTVQSLGNISLLVLSGSIAILLGVTWLVVSRATRPIADLTKSAAAVADGDLTQMVSISSHDEIGTLADTFNYMMSQLRDLVGNLEQRVAERTKALTTSAEVSHRISTILDQKHLVKEVVDQVQAAFNYYHVHIYLVDETSGDLAMAGGTGEAGITMLAHGHKVQRGRGLVGRTAETNSPAFVPDTSRDSNWLPNPLLPETKAEIAAPIAVGDQVLGVLDVQHNITDGLSRDDVTLIQSIANQVAVALRNARFYEISKSQAELETLINAIGQKIQRAGTVEDVLQTAIREVGVALGASRVSASLQPDRTAAEPYAVGGGNGADPKR